MPKRPVPSPLRSVSGLPERGGNLSIGIGVPKPPRHLPAAARREWRRVVEACAVRPTWLQNADRAALEAYCLAYAWFREASKALAEQGVLVPGRSSADAGRLVKNAAWQIARDASAEMRMWARELGFTPDARGRADLGALEPEADGPSDWD